MARGTLLYLFVTSYEQRNDIMASPLTKLFSLGSKPFSYTGAAFFSFDTHNPGIRAPDTAQKERVLRHLGRDLQWSWELASRDMNAARI